MTRSLADLLPPHDRHAEVSTLSAMVVDPGCIDDVVSNLTGADFYFDAHQKIFEAIAGLTRDAKPVDFVTVREELRRLGVLEDVGGDTYIADVFTTVPTSANARRHAGIIREAAIRRQLIHTAHEILRDAAAGAQPAEELLAGFESKLFDIGRGLADTNAGPVDAKTVMADSLRRIDERQSDGGNEVRGVPTGFYGLDEMLGGLRPGTLTLVAARPSIGKSSLAANFLLAGAAAGVPGLFASLEMSREEIGDRLLSMLSGVNLQRITGTSRLDLHEAGTLGRTSLAKSAAIWIDDRPNQTVARIASTLRRAVRRHGVGLLIVDYLQLVDPENSRDPRHLQVGMNATRLKQLARTTKVPIVALAQLNREVENRTDGKPRLADLRDSGQLEQDADAVILLHPKPVEGMSQVQEIDALVEKNRNGPRGVVQLHYRRPNVRFEMPSVEFR